MKAIDWRGDSLKVLRSWPEDVKDDVGHQLYLVQNGKPPLDSSPMSSIAPGVEEIREGDENGIYRVVYTARLENCVYVLHAFQKKTQKTPKPDIDLAKRRYADLQRELKAKKT